jgi:hypothetical protein
VVSALVLAIVAAGNAPPAPETATRRCCLTNQAYRGVCTVTLGEKETCENVLAYLNAPNTTGRTYCNSTRLRGGWEKVPCPPATPAPAVAVFVPSEDSAPRCPAVPCRAVSAPGVGTVAP